LPSTLAYLRRNAWRCLPWSRLLARRGFRGDQSNGCRPLVTRTFWRMTIHSLMITRQITGFVLQNSLIAFC
ncbi:hypothetical protein D030_1840B, partial [Vibrio parahaemolyticus AQ3810]